MCNWSWWKWQGHCDATQRLVACMSNTLIIRPPTMPHKFCVRLYTCIVNSKHSTMLLDWPLMLTDIGKWSLLFTMQVDTCGGWIKSSQWVLPLWQNADHPKKANIAAHHCLLLYPYSLKTELKMAPDTYILHSSAPSVLQWCQSTHRFLHLGEIIPSHCTCLYLNNRRSGV